MERVQGFLQALVPPGKAMAWLGLAGGGIFLGGMGFQARAGAFAQLPARVDSIDVVSDSSLVISRANRSAVLELQEAAAMVREEVMLLRIRSDSARAERSAMLCILVIVASGEQLTAPEVRQRCP